MSDNFFFPVFTGLLEPEHVEKIGSALWEFLWLISKVTKEVVENDETIGIVLGGRPVKNIEMSESLGYSLAKVERNISTLKKHGYITTKRTPYGNIFKVKNSKKFYKNRTLKNDGSDWREPSDLEREPSNLMERTLRFEGCNKDIKDIKEINTTRQSKKYDEDNTYFKMAIYFHEKVSTVANEAGISHLIKKSNMQTWADDMRKLIELDGVDKHLAKKVMDWVTEDSFWKTNVLSAKKLRERFMELAIKMNTDKKPSQPKQKPQYDPRDKEIAFQRWIQDGNDPDNFDWSD
ncbi:hypothetical protein [Lysinibacillus sp. BPa_S21]|uniref:hypothetical protein n=1 Tax=Lysinibacillus sp. BPa_S21 TaxID=2932478 RepID=UPI002011288F|nr:hypothetical protein [Lysinibacillus sp. BPa_S21]MCL1696558.1 hypothetical protein [Lysinibacillus sp. BPa_S21]